MKKQLLVLLLTTLPYWVFAQKIIEIENPLNATSFEAIINNVINFIFGLAVFIAPLMIIIAGGLFITSGGDISKIEQAKKIILWTVVGFAIILLSKGVLGIIKQLLGG